RSQIMTSLPRALQAASDRQNDRRMGQGNLFEAFTSEEPAAAVAEELPNVPPWPEAEKLKYEKEVLDFYFSSHPLAQSEEELRRYATHTVAELRGLPADHEVTLGGMLTQLRFMNTKKARNGNSRYARCKVEDFTGAAECVMWPDDFVRCKVELKEDQIYFLKGVVERNRDEPGVVLTRVFTLEQARQEMATRLYLLARPNRVRPLDLDLLRDVLRRTPGPCPVFLTVEDGA